MGPALADRDPRARGKGAPSAWARAAPQPASRRVHSWTCGARSPVLSSVVPDITLMGIRSQHVFPRISRTVSGG